MTKAGKIGIGMFGVFVAVLVGLFASAGVAAAAEAPPECAYDADGSGYIEYPEYVEVVSDYLNGRVGYPTLYGVGMAYINGSPLSCGEEEGISRAVTYDGAIVTVEVTVPRGTFESFYVVLEYLPAGARVVGNTADNYVPYLGGHAFIMLSGTSFTYTVELAQPGGEITGRAWDGLAEVTMPVTSLR